MVSALPCSVLFSSGLLSIWGVPLALALLLAVVVSLRWVDL